MTVWTGRLWSLSGAVTSRLDRLSDRRFALIAFLPVIGLVAIFVVPPILAVFGMSVWRVELLRAGDSIFVGTRNFERILADSEFLTAVPITVGFAIGTTLLGIPLALFSAMVLNRAFRGSTAVGVALLLPWAIAPVVTGLFWKFIFNPQFGIMTAITNGVGITDGAVPWLADGRFALGVAVIAATWRSVPLLSLLLLSRLRSIPESQYRAARMDGATSWQTFRYITMPALKNTLLVTLVLQIILSLQVFDIIFTLTGGGPGRATTTMIYYVYETAFRLLSFGYSSALALFLMGIIVLFSAVLLYLRLADRTPKVREDEPLAAPTAAPLRFDPSMVAGNPKPLHLPAPGRRVRRPAWLGRSVVVAAAGLLLVWSLGPIVWLLIASFQPESAVTSIPLQLQLEPYLGNYARLLARPDWIASTWVSVQVAVLTTVLVLVIGALAAYPLSRLQVPGRNVFMTGLILTQMVPAIVLAIPVLLTFKVFLRDLGLFDTVAALVIVNVAFSLPIVIWLLRNVLEDVSPSLDAAARIDGCSRIGSIFRVLFPAAAPGIAAVAILMLIGTWNEFLFAVVLGDNDAVTVTRQIGYLDARVSASEAPPYALSAAAGVLAMLPCVGLVVLFHRRIVSGLAEGIVKG
jgi:multiple sugar transport system permease protein